MSRETERIEQFYRAFQNRDGATMAACYTPDAHFRDPVFELHGDAIGAMWRMLCERGKDLRLEFSNVQASGDSGSADWQAWYSFSKTGRKVHNIIEAGFRFRDGLICEHVDNFSFWRWSRQALGPAGLLLGWTPLIRNKVRAEAAKGLAAFRAAG
jgi:ketosteroid isomerase-like protein